MTIRWGIIGCGDVVRRRVARAIGDAPDSELRAACRRDEQALQEFCRQFEVPRAYTHDADLLADAEIDAVYIATPVDRHVSQTIAAAKAGRHVLVEKPMAVSVAECEEMIAACRQHGVKLGVAYYRRFYPVLRRIKDILADGQIGRLMSISAVTSTPFALNPEDEGYWRVIPEEGGGGALMDIGSHRLDLFHDLCGEISGVKAFCDTRAASYNAEDCATLLLRFASGIHGSLHCYFGTQVGQDRLSIVGTGGQLIADRLNDGDLQVTLPESEGRENHPPPENLGTPLIADFVAAIREDRPPRITGEEGLQTNAVMQRAYQDARRDRGQQ